MRPLLSPAPSARQRHLLTSPCSIFFLALGSDSSCYWSIVCLPHKSPGEEALCLQRSRLSSEASRGLAQLTHSRNYPQFFRVSQPAPHPHQPTRQSWLSLSHAPLRKTLPLWLLTALKALSPAWPHCTPATQDPVGTMCFLSMCFLSRAFFSQLFRIRPPSHHLGSSKRHLLR